MKLKTLGFGFILVGILLVIYAKGRQPAFAWLIPLGLLMVLVDLVKKKQKKEKYLVKLPRPKKRKAKKTAKKKPKKKKK